ncbi:MAG: 6-hydroxycyclohex-1-ene-1-carbonyl-CoA dehydrogenase [Gammaproteobacteria bacterium]|nr:6-hydroxycyclohex-1-ene-1-carbonyl-CoA dehydrogenase [Gammaproteobacteria bacterium]
MSQQPYRWVMTGAGAPLERIGFDPAPRDPGEVVVEVAGCGVCHTDLGFYYDGVKTRHELPLALGHEVSGRIVSTGEQAREWLGRAVIVPAVIPCGDCDWCRRGKSSICPAQKMPGNDLHGGFASHLVVPAHGLCTVDEQRLARAGLTLADVAVVADAATTPYQAVHRSGLVAGDLAIVIGAGGVGGYTVQIARARGATVVAIDVDPGRLQSIAEHGAALTLNAREHDARAIKQAVVAFAKEHDLRRTEWLIFECSGTAAGQSTAWSLLTHGATLSVVGYTMDKIELRLSNLMAFDARAIGNWGCPPELYPPTLDLVLEGKVELLPFIERRPLEDINAVFADVHAGRLRRRVVLEPTTGGKPA